MSPNTLHQSSVTPAWNNLIDDQAKAGIVLLGGFRSEPVHMIVDRRDHFRLVQEVELSRRDLDQVGLQCPKRVARSGNCRKRAASRSRCTGPRWSPGPPRRSSERVSRPPGNLRLARALMTFDFNGARPLKDKARSSVRRSRDRRGRAAWRVPGGSMSCRAQGGALRGVPIGSGRGSGDLGWDGPRNHRDGLLGCNGLPPEPSNPPTHAPDRRPGNRGEPLLLQVS